MKFGSSIKLIIAIVLVVVACKKKPSAEQPIAHVDKVVNLRAFAGKDRVKLSWRISGDVAKCRIAWDGEKNIKEVSVISGQVEYEVYIDNLSEQKHLFSIVALNKNEVPSDKLTIECSSYGVQYQKSLQNRSYENSYYSDTELATFINWNTAPSDILETEITYVDEELGTQIIVVEPLSTSTKLAGLKPDSSFVVQTLYLPESSAIDTFYSEKSTVIVESVDDDEAGYSLVSLNADGPGDTYELLGQVLGGSPEETPDCAHPSFGRHIAEEFDTQLNENVFSFFAHVTPDNDRCGATDRQRTEIKTYGSSPSSVKAFIGDEMLFKWKFKLAAGFQPSSSFTHIHQIKAGDGSNDGSPLMTLTPRYGTAGDKLEVIHTGDKSSSSQGKVNSIDLEQLKGKWVQVAEKIKFDTQGTYELTISKVSTGEVVLHYVNNNIDFWRTGATFIRPKWGIYRSLNDAGKLRDEKVLFADFKIGKK